MSAENPAVNPRLIRLMASQYREMQGLATMADAMIPIAIAGLVVVARSWWDLLLAVPVAAVWAWLRLTWIRDRFDDFYDSRCGRVGWRPLPLSHTFLFTQALALGPGTILLSWPPLARGAYLLLMFTLYPTMAVVRDAPYRLYWILPLLVGVGAAVQHATLTTAAQADAWFIRVAVAGGVAIALAGLGDHLLLTRTLTGARREHAATKEELMS